MSDRAPTPEPADAGWVVDVTAPISPGRVQWIAADAAARLKLPVEKLASLLDNRVGPVTKPLPKASAERVAEVLDLAGAEVQLRPAGEQRPDLAPEASRAHPAAGPADASGGPADAAAAPPGADASPVPRAAPSAEDRSDAPGVAEPPPDRASGRSRSRPAAEPSRVASLRRPPDPGSAGDRSPDRLESDRLESDRFESDRLESDRLEPHRAEESDRAETGPVESDRGDGDRSERGGRAPHRAERAAPDRPDADRSAWADGFGDDASADSAMLGAWSRSAEAEGRRSGPPSSGEEPEAGTDEGTDEGADEGTDEEERRVRAAGLPIGRDGRRTERRAAGARRGTPPPLEEPPVLIDEEEEDDAFAYGTRDPFAEAERRERANRRWVLLGALALAVAAFLAVQWAYSRPGVDDRTPPAYEAGLQAYRQGAFVAAARSWRPRAEAGDARAMHMLGYMAEFGQGRPWSNAEAAGWYRQAAERGHVPAQLRLASLYARGLGVDRDPDAALWWALRAARAGDAEGAWRVVQDRVVRGAYDEAYAWLHHAAPEHAEAAAWLAMVEAAALNERSD